VLQPIGQTFGALGGFTGPTDGNGTGDREKLTFDAE
jgi:hypothetical protein